ncbi:large ribosomal subunit protein bL21m-like [Styela clava]
MLLNTMFKSNFRTISLTYRFLQNTIYPMSHQKPHLNAKFGIKSIHAESVKQKIQSELKSPSKTIPSYYDRYVFPEPPTLISENEHNKVISKVNEIVKDPGRLFAVVLISGHQYKVTTNDIISTIGYIQADCGTRIRLEKVGMVGGADFTLVGRPILKRNIVKVEATIIEKTPSIDVIIKRFMRRKSFERTYKFNSLHTILRINSIEVLQDLE